MDTKLTLERERAIDELKALVEGAGTLVGFTGAGISTESGVPDFRSPDSPWMRHKPIPFGQFLASPEARVEAWRRKFAMDDLYRGARPSRGHRVLARLAGEGRMPALITQNIDNLHQTSGIPEEQIVELHGNGSYAACLTCRTRHELAPIRAALEAGEDPSTCGVCGGIVKSATIAFGQALPAEAMRRASEAARAADLFLVVGSSLVVYPAAGFPILAKRSGARLVIVNREPTPLDSIADLVVRGEIGDVLGSLVPSA
jgi:NAD-dependent deacetylase